MTCPVCGGTMIGDGYTSVRHCENATEVDYEGREPDAGPILCRAPITCQACGEQFEPGDLDAVFFHAGDHKPRPDINYEDSRKVSDGTT